MPNISSVSPHYLNDPTSFKETLDTLTEAKSLSVNSQGTLVPTGLFNNAFQAETFSNRRLVELKIMEFLIHGKKWLKPHDLHLMEKLADKVGLSLEKNNQTHKELHLLINLIAKEVLQKEVIPQKDYLDLCQAFQTHYRGILAAYPNHCEQVNAFADSFKLQKEEFIEEAQPSYANSYDTEQHERLDIVSNFITPENDLRDNTILPTPISKKVRTIPNISLHRKKLNSYEKSIRLASQVALGTMGTLVTGTALYHSCKFLNSIKFSYLNTDLPKVAPQISYTGLGIISLGISTIILGTAYFFKERNRSQLDQTNIQSDPFNPNLKNKETREFTGTKIFSKKPNLLNEKNKDEVSDIEEPINLDFMNNDTPLDPIEPDMLNEKIEDEVSDNEEPINLDFMNNNNPLDPTEPDMLNEKNEPEVSNNKDPIDLVFNKTNNLISPLPNSFKPESVLSAERRNDAAKVLRDKKESIKGKNKTNSPSNNFSVSPTNKIRVMKNAVILTPTKEGLKKEDLLECLNKVREEYIQRHDESSITGEDITNIVVEIQHIIAGSLNVLKQFKPSFEAKKTYKYAVSALTMLVDLLNSHQKKLSENTSMEKEPLQDFTSYLDFFDHEDHTNKQIRILMDYYSLMASLHHFKNASKTDMEEKILECKQEIFSLMKQLPLLEPTVIKSHLEKFTLEELYALQILHTRHMNNDIVDAQINDTEESFIHEAWSIVFDRYKEFENYLDESISHSELASEYGFLEKNMDAIYEEFKNFNIDTMEFNCAIPKIDFDQNIDAQMDSEMSFDEVSSNEDFFDSDVCKIEQIEGIKIKLSTENYTTFLKGNVIIQYKNHIDGRTEILDYLSKIASDFIGDDVNNGQDLDAEFQYSTENYSLYFMGNVIQLKINDIENPDLIFDNYKGAVCQEESSSEEYSDNAKLS